MILVLQKNTTLKVLSLSDNKIGPDGGKAIAKALEVSLVFVSSFSFSCAVTPPAVTHFISVILVLQKNTALQVLDLRSNKIGPEGGKAIAKALEVSPFFVSFFSFSCAVTPYPR